MHGLLVTPNANACYIGTGGRINHFNITKQSKVSTVTQLDTGLGVQRHQFKEDQSEPTGSSDALP